MSSLSAQAEAGAVLGLALAQKGIKNIVLEQAPGPPTGLRGEILQPNGQQILDRLGVLSKLPADATRSVRHFHFCKVGGERLCSVDYAKLPVPYNRAIVTLPNAAHHAILGSVEKAAPGALRYGASFKGLRREGARVAGVDIERGGQTSAISARLVVGADGAFSKVREALGIPTKLHLYREGYLIAILDSPDGRALFEAGWAAEVDRLLAAGTPHDAPGMQSLGYGTIAEAIAGGRDPWSCLDAVTTATQQYAKRQETFFRGEKDAVWIDASAPGSDTRARELVGRFLRGDGPQ